MFAIAFLTSFVFFFQRLMMKKQKQNIYILIKIDTTAFQLTVRLIKAKKRSESIFTAMCKVEIHLVHG